MRWSVPLDEVIEEVFDSLLHLRFLQGDWVTFVGDLHDQLPQFVQLTLDLEETLGCQSKPERGTGERGFHLQTLCHADLGLADENSHGSRLDVTAVRAQSDPALRPKMH